MPRNKVGSSNGGVIGKTNKSSFGKCTVSTKTSTGNLTLQPGTREISTTIVSGGGGGSFNGGGGGAGGMKTVENLPVSGPTVPITIGGGGAGGTVCSPRNACAGSPSNIVTSCGTQSTSGGGIGGCSTAPGGSGGSGGGGGYSEAIVSLNGQEKFRSMTPDDELKAIVSAKQANNPDWMPYFHLQHDDYVTLKERVCKSILEGKKPEGIATIEVAIETLKLVLNVPKPAAAPTDMADAG